MNRSEPQERGITLCGILGFIGRSKSPKTSFELANALFIKTESRGEHAAGFWACERGNNQIFYDKEPVKSTIYVGRDIWSQQFAAVDADLLIAHCRFSTAGAGHEKHNKNNHPHASANRRTALVHNGKIPEYSALKSRYDLRSDCDSEILLSMFESGEEFKNKEDYLKQEFPNLPPDIAYRMMGMKEVFSRVNYGAMAVAVAERADNERGRRLWLFRDEERPLHVIDLRSTIGQIFFCSTAEIWRSAVEMTPGIKPYIPDDQRVIEFPAYQVWMLQAEPSDEEVDNPDKDVWKTKKFKITKTKFYDYKAEDDDGKKMFRSKAPKVLSGVISRLLQDEEVATPPKTERVESKVDHGANTGTVPSINRKKKSLISPIVSRDREGDVDPGTLADDDDDIDARTSASNKDSALSDLNETTLEPLEIDMASFDGMVTELEELLTSIKTNVAALQKADALSPKDFSVIMNSLRDAQAELKGSLLFIKP